MDFHHANVDVCLADLAVYPARVPSWSQLADKAAQVYLNSMDGYVFGLSLCKVDPPRNVSLVDSDTTRAMVKPRTTNMNTGSSPLMWVPEDDLRRDARVALRTLSVELCLHLALLSDYTEHLPAAEVAKFANTVSTTCEEIEGAAQRAGIIPVLQSAKLWTSALVAVVASSSDLRQRWWIRQTVDALLRCCEGLMLHLYSRVQSCSPECIRYRDDDDVRNPDNSVRPTSESPKSPPISKRRAALEDVVLLCLRAKQVRGDLQQRSLSCLHLL